MKEINYLTKDQNIIFDSSDNFLILITISLDDLLILLGENCCWSLSGLRGLIKELADERSYLLDL